MFMMMFTTPAHARDPFIGHWAWQQHTTTSSGHTSLCVGEADFLANKTFSIWNACKRDNNSCFVIETATDGTWKRVDKGTYIAGYGQDWNGYPAYYYVVTLSPDNGTASFSSMTVVDEWVVGKYEFGTMYKGRRIDNLKPWFGAFSCK